MKIAVLCQLKEPPAIGGMTYFDLLKKMTEYRRKA